MDIEKLSNLCLDITTEWQEVQLSYKNRNFKEKIIMIPLVYTGSNGIYVFLEEKYKNDVNYIYQELERIFNIRGDGLYLFFYEKKEADEDYECCRGWAYDVLNKNFIELADIYEAFDIFYYNHYIPQAELPFYTFKSFEDYFEIHEISMEKDEETEDEESNRYVRPMLSSSKVKYAEEKLVEILSSGIKKGNYTYYNDGRITVKKIAKGLDSWKKPWESYTEQKTYDFPCSDEEGEKTFLRTLMGGWFGLHKFKDKKFLQGLLYLISCGGCCMFYFIDVIAVMTGNYFTTSNHYFRGDYGKVQRVQSKVYNRPIKNKKLFLLFPIMIILTLCLLKYVYVPFYEYGSLAISEFIQEIVSNSLNKVNIN